VGDSVVVYIFTCSWRQEQNNDFFNGSEGTHGMHAQQQKQKEHILSGKQHVGLHGTGSY
jgi:hypothetical protein